MKKLLLCALVLFGIVGLFTSCKDKDDEVITLRYTHMNTPESVAGKQAVYFSDKVKELSDGTIIIEVYPSSQLGTIQEMAEMVSNGTVAFHHNTMAGIGSLYSDYSVFDTPYLFKDVDHLMRVTDVNSTIMQTLNDGMIKERNVKNLYNFYFGTRQLTTNKAVYTPADLKGMKVRAIPFPIYMTAVEGMGALATPIDWSEVPTALATGAAHGQENPVNIIYANKLFDVQSHLMLTGHIMGAEAVVVNNGVWEKFSPEQQELIQKAATETAVWATEQTEILETADLKNLENAGMVIISEDTGLDLEAFRSQVQKLVQERFSAEYGDLYTMIDAIQ